MNLFDYHTNPEELLGYDERGAHYVVPSLAFQYLRRHLKYDDNVRIEKLKKALVPVIAKDEKLLSQYNKLTESTLGYTLKNNYTEF